MASAAASPDTLRQALAVAPQIAIVILVSVCGPRARDRARHVLLTASLVLPAILGCAFTHVLFDAKRWSAWMAAAGLVLYVVPPLGAWLALASLRNGGPLARTMAALVGGVLVVVAPFVAVVVAFVPCMLTHCM